MPTTFYQKLLILLIVLLLFEALALIASAAAPMLFTMQQLGAGVDPNSAGYKLLYKQVNDAAGMAGAVMFIACVITGIGISDVWGKASSPKQKNGEE